MRLAQIKEDVKFDRYGDVSFLGNDIDTITDRSDILHQNVVDRLISNFADYKHKYYFGANCSGFIGKPAHLIEEDVIFSIRRSLTDDDFLSPSMVKILSLVDGELIHIRIDIDGGIGKIIPESIKINSVFNTSSGTLHVTY